MSVYPYASLESMSAAAEVGMTTARYAAHTPDRMAIYSEHGDRTFGELNSAANRIVRIWRRAGLQPGDAVALMMRNRPEFFEVWDAARRSGIRITPVNWHLAAAEVSYIVGDCDARVFVTESSFGGVAARVSRDHAGLDLRLMVVDEGEEAPEGYRGYAEALAEEEGDDISDPVVGRFMLYTSGTTGRPKGVFRPERPPYYPVWDGAVPWLPFGGANLLTGPAYHAAPLSHMSRSLVSGMPVVLMDKWEAERTLELIERFRITHTHMVPTMFHRLLALPAEMRERYDLSSLKLVSHGAAPCPVPVKKAMIDWFGPVLSEYYGGSEGGGGAVVSSAEWLKRPGTVGRPQNTIILDDDGNRVGPGVMGQIWMIPRSDVFTYYKDPDKTEHVYKGEYFTLGDLGYQDEEGWLFLTGRSAEVIISGGVNIYPQEVDDYLLQHEAVEEACTAYGG